MADENLTLDDIPALFEALADRMYRYAWSLCGDPDEAADLVQTAFVRCVEQVGAGRVRRETAENYLTRTVRNLSVDMHRRKQRLSRLEREEEIPAGERELARAEQSRLVYSLVAETVDDVSLPEDVRLVLRLRFLEQYEVSEIIEKTGRSRSAVYRLMERAVRHLSERLATEGIGVEDLD